MVEQEFKMTVSDVKTVEKVIADENLHYMHLIFNANEGTPEHFTNATVYMTVLRGILSIKLNDQEVNEYDAGSVLKIPFNTKMIAKNLHKDILELTVIKAPAPEN